MRFPVLLFLLSLLLLEIAAKVKTDQQVVCGYPGLPDGGRIKSGGKLSSSGNKYYSAGDVVAYTCKTGRVLAGPEERRCHDNGTWSGAVPLCRQNLALKQPSLQSGGGDHVNFAPTLAVDGDLNTCTYTPVSTEQRWWQVQIPRTVIESVAVSITPSSHQQFTIFVIELVEGSKALYKPCATFQGNFVEPLAVFLCNGGKGYKGEFVYIRDDREDGPGVEYFSLCEVRVFGLQEDTKCGTPEQNLGSLVTRETMDNGVMVARIKCQDGWIMVHQDQEEKEEEEAILHCDRGHWRGKTKICKEIECPDPVSPKSGYIEVSNFKGRYQFGSVATYRCNPGYILWGNDTRVCSASGSWSGHTPSCNPISCGTPPTLDTNTIMELVNVSTTWRSLASYTCLPGYKDTENKTVVYSTCLTEGSWSSVTLNCKYDPGFLSGGVGAWNISESLKVNMMPVIIISVCGVMFIISIIVAIIVISHRVMSSSSSSGNHGPRSKQSPASHHHLLYDQVGLPGDEEDYNIYDSHSLIEDPYGDVSGKVGVIVYDDLKNPHLVETDPSSILSIRSPLPERRSPQSDERSSGDGGSDKGGHYDKVASPQYATVGRRIRQDMDIYSHYSVLRRPDGESDEASEDQMYETVNKLTETDRSLSSETSSLSQATVRLAGKDDNNSVASTSGDNTPTAFNNINITTNNLYARVDLKMKKKPPTISSAEDNKGAGGTKDI